MPLIFQLLITDCRFVYLQMTFEVGIIAVIVLGRAIASSFFGQRGAVAEKGGEAQMGGGLLECCTS